MLTCMIEPRSTEEAIRTYFAGDPRTQRERMFAGDTYITDDPAIIEDQAQAVRHVAEFCAAYNADPAAGQVVARRLFGSLDETAWVRAPVYVDYGTHVTIGPRTFINMGLTALDVAPIVIGADCQIGPHVQLLTATHPVEPEPRRDKVEGAKPITIGDNVWLGGGVIICPGVTIGDNSVIGAGAVVTRDIPANTVAVGNPARIVREIGDTRPS